MAELLRNEVAITFAGATYTMRASFTAIRNIERDLKTNIIPLISSLGSGDMGVGQAAMVVYHGLLGYGDESMTLEQVGDAIMNEGLDTVMIPVVNFLGCALKGVKVGKPQAGKPRTAKPQKRARR